MLFYSPRFDEDVLRYLRDLFVTRVKKDIIELVAHCPNFQQVKVEHQKSVVLV